LEKANFLNDFFVVQTRIDESQAPILTDLFNISYHLDDLTISPDVVQLVMKSLLLEKAAGPDDINNRNSVVL
jgi:hypothetical protein